MPLAVEDFAPKKAYDEIIAALRNIDIANGYNNRITVGESFVPVDDVGQEELPFACLHPVVLNGDETTDAGDSSSTTIADASLDFAVWCYFEDEYSLEEAMFSLLADVLGALWEDESFGITIVATDFIRARWMLPAMQDTNRGALAVEMRARLYFPR